MSLISRFAPLCLGALVCVGCVTPIRGSSRTFAPTEVASARFAGNSEDSAAWLVAAFDAAGFPQHREYGKGKMVMIQGKRADVAGQVYWGRNERAPLTGWTVEIGSVFYAYLKPSKDGATTELTVIGKPTVAGHAVCSNDDPTWGLPCEDVEAVEGWRADDLNGAAEAAVIAKVLGELGGIATFEPPANVPSPPEGTNECDWAYATGSHFQKLECSVRDEGDQKRENQKFMNRPAYQCVSDGKGGCRQ